MTTILLVEDSPVDAFTVRSYLEEIGPADWTVEHVTMLGAASDFLKARSASCILLDLGLPDSRGLDGIAALQLNAPATPLIVLTGQDDSTLALEAVRLGAQDYLNKGAFTCETLMRCILYAIERKRLLETLRAKNEELRHALDEIKTLRGFIPICARCKKVRDDTGDWEEVETYIRSHSTADFSHTYCPDCYAEEIKRM